MLFCAKKNGWGWENFLREVNTGEGIRFAEGLRLYMLFVLPMIIVVIYLKGYYDMFKGQGTAVLAGWMAAAVLFLGFVLYCAGGRKEKE